MEDWGKASLEINHSIAAQILGLFISDALQSFLGLHDGDGVHKPFQVFCQAALIGSAEKPIGKRTSIIGGKAGVVGVSG